MSEVVLRQVGAGAIGSLSDRGKTMITGAAIGAGVGGVIGALWGGGLTTAAIGAALLGGMGAAVGYASGNATATGTAPTQTPEPTGTQPPDTNQTGSNQTVLGEQLPAGPYTNLGKSAQLLPGHTYLMSTAHTGSGAADLIAAGWTVSGAWVNPPAGWPSDETITAGTFVAATAPASGGSQRNGADVTTWATGGASS